MKVGDANRLVTLEMTLTSFFKVIHIKYRKSSKKCADSILLSSSKNMNILKRNPVQNSLMRDMPLYGNIPYNSVNMSDRGVLVIGHIQESLCCGSPGYFGNDLDLIFKVTDVKYRKSTEKMCR